MQESISGSKKRPKTTNIRSKILLWTLIIIGVIFGVLFMLQYFGHKTNTSGQVSTSGSSEENANISLVEQFKLEEPDTFLEQPFFSDLLPFTINLKNGRRFLKTVLYLGVSDQRILSYIQSRMPIVKDIIITTIQYKTAEELEQATGIETLRTELLRKLNQELFTQQFLDSLENKQNQGIRRIFFSEFIIQ